MPLLRLNESPELNAQEFLDSLSQLDQLLLRRSHHFYYLWLTRSKLAKISRDTQLRGHRLGLITTGIFYEQVCECYLTPPGLARADFIWLSWAKPREQLGWFRNSPGTIQQYKDDYVITLNSSASGVFIFRRGASVTRWQEEDTSRMERISKGAAHLPLPS